MNANEHNPARIKGTSISKAERKGMPLYCLKMLKRLEEIEEMVEERGDLDKRLDHVERHLEGPIWDDFWKGSAEYEQTPSRPKPFYRHKYRKPEAAERVLETVKSYQREKLAALVPEYLERFGDLPGWEWYGQIEGEIYVRVRKNWHDHPEELYRVCVERKVLEIKTHLDHETLNRNTEHLKHRGDLFQFGKRGGRGRIKFSVSWIDLNGLLSIPLDAELRRRFPNRKG